MMPIYKGDTYSKPRPVCLTEGCTNLAHNTASAKNPVWRKYCGTCHNERRKNFQNLSKNLSKTKYPKCCIKDCNKKVTLLGTDHEGNLKFSQYCDKHGGTAYHLQWRKTYCENIDGRLGFICTTNIHYDPPLTKDTKWIVDYGYPQPMLEVDHINGNPFDEPTDGSNFQTLCSCCHKYKTWKSGDGLTAGRKQVKPAREVENIN